MKDLLYNLVLLEGNIDRMSRQAGRQTDRQTDR